MSLARAPLELNADGRPRLARSGHARSPGRSSQAANQLVPLRITVGANRPTCGIVITMWASFNMFDTWVMAATSQQLLQGDRKVGDTFSGRIEDCVGDRGRYSDDDDLAKALDAEWVGNSVLPAGQERRVKDRNVGVDGGGMSSWIHGCPHFTSGWRFLSGAQKSSGRSAARRSAGCARDRADATRTTSALR
jgi:hypothetical protein